MSQQIETVDVLNQELDVLLAAINGLIRVADPRPGSEVEAVSCGLEGQYWRVKKAVENFIQKDD